MFYLISLADIHRQTYWYMFYLISLADIHRQTYWQGSGNPIICRFRPILNSWDRFIFQKMLFYRSEKKCILADYKCIFQYRIIIKFERPVFVCLFFLNRSIIHRFSQSTPLDYSRVKLLIVQLSKHCSKTTESCPNYLSRFLSLHSLQTSKFLIGSGQLH